MSMYRFFVYKYQILKNIIYCGDKSKVFKSTITNIIINFIISIIIIINIAGINITMKNMKEVAIWLHQSIVMFTVFLLNLNK